MHQDLECPVSEECTTDTNLLSLIQPLGYVLLDRTTPHISGIRIGNKGQHEYVLSRISVMITIYVVSINFTLTYIILDSADNSGGGSPGFWLQALVQRKTVQEEKIVFFKYDETKCRFINLKFRGVLHVFLISLYGLNCIIYNILMDLGTLMNRQSLVKTL